jgi:hypothetical protein
MQNPQRRPSHGNGLGNEEEKVLLLRWALWFAWSLLGCCALSQTVQPVISEYQVKADGKFALTNGTLTPMVVVLEPKSFSITPDGQGLFRPLDKDIHVELSAMSARLEPGQTYYVFYKAHAEQLPAWFTVYSTFSSVQHHSGLDVRIMLPHTVYLYQKHPLNKEEINIPPATYNAAAKTIVCDVENHGTSLVRVEEVRISGPHASESSAGFPLLPLGRRHLELSWDEKQPPDVLQFRFEHFTLKVAIAPGGN